MTTMNDFDLLKQWAAEDGDASPIRGIPEAQPEGTPLPAGTGPQPGRHTPQAGTPAQAIDLSSPPKNQGRSKRNRSVDDGGEKKKHKSGKSHGHNRSPKIDLLGLGDEDCARFKEEPFEVMADAMKAAGILFKKYQEEESDRLEEMRGERDDLLKKMKELEPRIEAAADNERKLVEAERQLVAAVSTQTQAESALDKVVADKETAEKEVERLSSKNQELSSQVVGLKTELDAMEVEKNNFRGRYKDVLDRAKGAAEGQFENAVSQIKILYPDLGVDREIVQSTHRAIDQQIVRPKKIVKGKVLQEEAVIYQAPSDS